MITAAQLAVKLSSDGVTAVKDELKGAGAAADETGLSLKTLALGASAIAGAALVALGAKAIGMAGDFQASMTQLVTGAGESQGNLKLVSDGILKMAVDTGTSTQQLSDGMYMIESAGYHGAAGLDVLKASAEGAKVGNANLADVANGVTTEMTDYAGSNLTAAQATNILVATVANGKTHMGDLANAMAAILPTASAVGVKLIDVQGAMATMTGEGVPAADAATYLRQTLMALDAPSAKTVKALASVGLKSTDVANELKVSLPDTLKMITDAVGKKFPEGSAGYVNALKDIAGGSKQMQGVLDLTGDHMKTLKGNVSSITDAVNKGGKSIIGWTAVQGDFNTKLDRAKEVAETFMISLGTKLLPVASQVMDFFANTAVPAIMAVNDKFTALTSFITSHEDVFNALKALFIGVSVAILTAAAPAIWASVVAFGAQAVAAGAAAVATLLAAAPFILLALVVGAAIFVIIEIVQHWKQLSAVAMQVLGPAIGWIGDKFSGLGTFVSGVASKIQDLINWFLKMVDAAGKAMNAAKGAVNSVPVVGGIASWAGFAEGTDYAPGGMAMVGESGPELVYLPQGAKVVPNNRLGMESTPSGAGSGQTGQPIYLQIDGQTFASVVLPHLAAGIRTGLGVRV